MNEVLIMDMLAAMKLFARVVDLGSFSAAGRQMGMSPSAVSRAIGDLEEELKVRLFYRTTRKLSLTDAGQMYDERVRQIISRVDDANLAVREAAGVPSGILRVTSASSMARLHLAPAIATFRKEYPAVEVMLRVTDTYVDLVADGIDVAVRVGELQDSSMIAKRVGLSRRRIWASPAFLEKHGTPGTPEALPDFPAVLFRDHPGPNVWRFEGPKKSAHEIKMTGVMYANDGDAVISAAVAGLGLINAPEWLAGRAYAAGELTCILDEYTSIPLETPINAVYPHARHLPAKVRAFVDFLGRHFSQSYDWAKAV